jgi:hypothetical protein
MELLKILTDKESIQPILYVIGNGTYEVGRWPVTPGLEMKITLKNGREVTIGEFKTRTICGKPSTTFMVHTPRILYPRDMIMGSDELEAIFDDLEVNY